MSVFTVTDPEALIGIGTIKNTDGANSLTVRETAIDRFGSTVSSETVVTTATLTLLLNPEQNLTNGAGAFAYPPFTSYQVEVKSTTPGSPATYELHFGR